jgi:hypothetical protein
MKFDNSLNLFSWHTVRVGFFKERKTKLTLLSLLSAMVVISTAFTGVAIYTLRILMTNTTATTAS